MPTQTVGVALCKQQFGRPKASQQNIIVLSLFYMNVKEIPRGKQLSYKHIHAQSVSRLWIMFC